MVLNVCQPLLHAKTSGKTHKLLQSPQGALSSGHLGWLSEEMGQPSTHHNSVMEQVRGLIRRTGLSKKDSLPTGKTLHMLQVSHFSEST